uniref:Uncharacterized protein n=1 Tax=viral metagenome TaxID=1070528 RepID=A0A6M3IWC8_9ZZZZ
MEWEIGLSNGESWNRKQLYKEKDLSPFRRLLKYMKDGDLSITSFKIILPSCFLHLPSTKGKIQSEIEPLYFWIETNERFGGYLGSQLKSIEIKESVSYRLGDTRVYYWVNENNNVWCQILPLNHKKEKEIEKTYVGTV